MQTKLSSLFLVIEVNLVLWIILLGRPASSSAPTKNIKTVTIIGLAFAAIVQHWAYYNIRKATTAK